MEVFFIIPSIGRDSLIDTIQSLSNLTDNNWSALIIFDKVKNPITINQANIHFIETENKVGKIDKKNNAGLVRNIGFSYIRKNNIKTKYIAFVDDDDTLHPNYIEHLKDNTTKFSNPDVIIFRMMYSNYQIIPHPQTRKLQVKNVGISFAVKSNLIENEEILFQNHPFEDYIFLQSCKVMKKKIIISNYVNYFVRATFHHCKDQIKTYIPIII